MKLFNNTLLNSDDLNAVIDNLKIGVIAHLPDRTITLFNKEAERITGFSRDEVIGKDCHNVFQAPFCGEKCSFCNATPDFSGGLKEYPINFITRDGRTKHIEMSVTAIKDQQGDFAGVVASFRDLTRAIDLSIRTETLSNFVGIIGKEKVMQDIFKQIKDVAVYNYPVHISGETGTGKERVANAIHTISSYGEGAFVPVNCGAIPEGIVESELFGHVKGAFSGAVRERKGRFELAHKGTLFLDEVADLPLKTQVKILRFLQEGVFEKVGGEKAVSVDTRIISATNKNLKEEVKANRFREDLYYRLNVIPIKMPLLKERKTDIPLLIEHFLKEAELESHRKAPAISKEALDIMLKYSWPGNVRELKNVIQFSVVHSKGEYILPQDLPMELTQITGLMPTPDADFFMDPVMVKGKLDMDSVKAALKKAGGNKSKAAKLLRVGRATLYRFLNQNPEIKEYSSRL
ncbi:MAG: PAS domain-containing protein [Desulfobacteraceae bacterium]|nr:MAG: PAS domain-containing protein [Desulfobacteraceae bacterium]